MGERDENWSERGRAPTEDESELRDRLRESGATRRDAALALVDIADSGLSAATVGALAECLAESGDSDARQFAVEALGTAGSGREHVERALGDDDEWVRAEAVVALSRIDPGASDRLREALTDESGWVRRNAVIALSKTEAIEAEELVDRLKNDRHPAVREYAAQFLPGVAETERAVRLLAAVLAREPNSFVRVKAAEGLGDLGTDRAEEALERHGLSDRSDDVRRTAEQALARSRGVDPEALDVDERVGSRDERGPPGGGPQQRPRPDGKTVGQRTREEGPAPRRAEDLSNGRGP
jgi:HEAT repeat protein